MNNTEEFFNQSQGGGIDDDNFTNPGSGAGFDSGKDFTPPPTTERSQSQSRDRDIAENNREEESDFEPPDFSELQQEMAEFQAKLEADRIAREEAERKVAEFDATLLDREDLVPDTDTGFSSGYLQEQESSFVLKEPSFVLREPSFLISGNRLAAVDTSIDTSLGYSPNYQKYIFFDIYYYLQQNPDVAAANINPLKHFTDHGESEGREYRYVYPSGLLTEEDIAPQTEDSLLNTSSSDTTKSEFDRDYYLTQNPDVAASGIDPYEHYIDYGQAEGRIPYADFESLSMQNNELDTSVLNDSANDSFI